MAQIGAEESNVTTGRLPVFTHVRHSFTFMYLADAFIQSDLQYMQVIYFLSVCVFSGN